MSYTGGTTSREFRRRRIAKATCLSGRVALKLSRPGSRIVPNMATSSTGVLSNTNLYPGSSEPAVNIETV